MSTKQWLQVEVDIEIVMHLLLSFISHLNTSQIYFRFHKTMAPSRGWQWERNTFTVIFHIQPQHFSNYFNVHKTMAPSRGWQWDRNAFTVIFHIQPQHFPNYFNVHKTMAPSRGWQWNRNAFTVIFHIQPRHYLNFLQYPQNNGSNSRSTMRS